MTATQTYPGLRTRLMVGMEIHVELATRSKMWTSAPNVAHPDFHDAAPNTLTDPVVLGMPGVLPVMNRRAVELSMLLGLALNCKIASFTKWDRKSYYYPDLPKNYQISQYDLPLCYEGYVDVPLSEDAGVDAPTQRIRILRAHLEEDAGKLMHEAPGGGSIDGSIIDLNRAGTPLLEIVTYPDFQSAEQCVIFSQMLRQICRHLGVTEGIMQRGHMRFEPNINVIIQDASGREFRTPIAEIKNLNSFRSLEGAINHEYQRQVDEFLRTGKTLIPGSKSTRGWDDVRQSTFLQREKEEAHDYRYFPDPDLVPLKVSEQWVQQVRASLPELPAEREKRYAQQLGLDSKTLRQIMDEPRVTAFFESLLKLGMDGRKAASMLLNNLAKRANERGVPVPELGVTPEQIKGIADLAAADKIGSTAVDKLIDLCCDPAARGQSAEQLAQQHNLMQVSDTGALEGLVQTVLSDPKNQKAVADFAGGKDQALGNLLGQIMKLSGGKANAKLVGDIIRQKLRG